ncbi:MAG: phage terminase large subunit [Thermoguttaceae bacterium]|nr:phage terminase large subunit [Thermoguttaceae bacterium]
MEGNRRYEPTAAQLALRRLIRDKTRILAYGGSRSGKTFEFCHALAALGLRYGGRYAIFRRYHNAARYSVFDDTFPKMLELCFPGLRYKRNVSDARVAFEHNGAEFWFVGLDDERRVEKILGREYGAIYFNECSEIGYPSVEIAMTRLAQRLWDAQGKPLRNRAFFDCNPPGKSHWTHRLFIEGISPTTKVPVPDFESYGAIQINPRDNEANLPPNYIATILGGGSERMKKRFLYGEFANDVQNALWKEEWINENRALTRPDYLERVVVAIDPAVTANAASAETGIVVVGRGRTASGEPRFYVLDDRSETALPERWARDAVEAYRFWRADAVVAEVNQGGDLVAAALRRIDPYLPVKTVRATRGKIVRAEPVAILYSRGLASHVGKFPELEEEMTTYVGARSEDRKSDRLDALVWAITALMEDDGECNGGFLSV